MTFIDAREACSFFSVVLWSFVTIIIILFVFFYFFCALGGWPLLGTFATVPSFFHLEIMAHTVAPWNP